MNKSFKITIEQVHAGYDLTISKDQQSATLLMPDKEQANSIAQKIINLAEQHNMTINAACSLFNTGAAMYSNNLRPNSDDNA